MPTLHEMTSAYAALYEIAADPEADEDSFHEALYSIDCDIRSKAEGLAAVIRTLDHLSEGIYEHIKRQQKRIEAIDKKADWLRGYLLIGMEIAGRNRIETDSALITVATNPPKLVIAEGADIPVKYKVSRTVETVDKVSLKRDVLSGQAIDGVSVVSEKRVMIK